MTYDELDAAYEQASTPDEKTEAKQRLEKFEQEIENAESFYQSKAACYANAASEKWFCQYHGSYPHQTDKTSFDTLDDLVRTYRRERSECGCTSKDDAERYMRDLQRQMKTSW